MNEEGDPKVANQPTSVPKEPKEEPLFANEIEIPQQNFIGEAVIKEEEKSDDGRFSTLSSTTRSSFDRSLGPSPVKVKEEDIEAEDEIKKENKKGKGTTQKPKFFDNGEDVMMGGSMEEEGEKEEAEAEAEEEHIPVQKTKETSETVELDKRRRSSRIVPTAQTHNAEDSEEMEVPVKKSRSELAKRDGKKTLVTKKDTAQSGQRNRTNHVPHDLVRVNGTVLECPECEYQTRSVTGWIQHLRSDHSTNPTLAGLALLCKCGNESVSKHHSYTCSVANFTVIRKSVGPIRRLEEEKTTPQCVLCDAYPTTPTGYIGHLRRHHNSTLISNGIFLKCSCGDEFLSHNSKPDHSQKCNGRQFSLHKLDGE